MDVSAVNTDVCGSMCAYNKYKMHGPKQEHIEPVKDHVGTYAVVNIQEGVSYADALQRTRGL